MRKAKAAFDLGGTPRSRSGAGWLKPSAELTTANYLTLVTVTSTS